MVSGNELQQDELPSQSSVISWNGKESLALPREDRTAPQSSPNVALPKCAGALCFLNTLPFPLFLHDLFKQIFMFVGICYLYTEGERESSAPPFGLFFPASSPVPKTVRFLVHLQVELS